MSEKPFDWLGAGIYFWESDEQRAWEWARKKADDDAIREPFVVGAAIDLGNCLDLTHRENLDLLSAAYSGLKARFDAAGRSLPENKDPRGSTHGDKVLRHLDCAVITYLHAITMEAGQANFDTVRGLFVEGGPIYPGAAFHRHSHTQIAVRTADCICGLFRVREQAMWKKRAAGKPARRPSFGTTI